MWEGRLIVSPVPGAKERIEVMVRRFGELSEEVGRLEGLVEEQRRELEVQNSSRFGGMYDDGDEAVVTQSMVDQEEGQVHQLEDKIKAMQEKVRSPYSTPDVDLDCAIGWKDRFCIIGCIVWSLRPNFEYVQLFFPFHVNDARVRLFMNQSLRRLCVDSIRFRRMRILQTKHHLQSVFQYLKYLKVLHSLVSTTTLPQAETSHYSPDTGIHSNSPSPEPPISPPRVLDRILAINTLFKQPPIKNQFGHLKHLCANQRHRMFINFGITTAAC